MEGELERKLANEREYILFQTLNRALFICEENMRGPNRGAEDLIEATFRLRTIRKIILDMYAGLGALEAKTIAEELDDDDDDDENEAEPARARAQLSQN